MKKTNEQVDAIMEGIWEPARYRWCGAEAGPCACRGCVQIGSRAVMVERMTGRKYVGDPEYIDERRIPADIRDSCKITREEWEDWKLRHPQAEATS